MLLNLTNIKMAQNLSSLEHLVRQKRHYNFVGNVEVSELCYRPRNFKENISEACTFVTTEQSCNIAVNLINYLKHFVCTFKMDNSFLGASLATIATLAILTMYFVCLYVVSRHFLLPNSIVLANYFNMKNYDFGVIILAPLFSLPSSMSLVFSCNAASRSSSSIYAQGFGCMFTSFVIGMCILSYRNDIRLIPQIFMREMLFLGIVIMHIHYAVEWEAENENTPEYIESASYIMVHAYIITTTYIVYALNIILFSRARYQKPEIHVDPSKIPSSSETLESDAYPDFYENPIEHTIVPFDIFTESISPKEAFQGVSMFLQVFMYPFYIALALIVPVVRRKRRLHGWCKFVFCMSFLAIPFYFLNWNMGDFMLISVTIIGIIFSLLALFISHNQRIPAHHDLVALWGLVLGTAIVDLIDREVDALVWQLLTYLQNWNSDTIIILAFPLSYVFVEGIFVITLLKNDHRRMATGFVIGTVMFIAYTLIPITVTTVCLDKDPIYYLTSNTTTAFYFMIIVQGVTVFGLAINGFELRRSICIFYAIVQVVYSLFMILSNSEIIHPYGSLSTRSVYLNALHTEWA